MSNFHNTRILNLDEIKYKAPSVFAETPWHETSENYRFIPTSRVLTEAFKNGFVCVKAGQSNTRIEGKGEFTKHVLRLRHQNNLQALAVGDIIPEIVLTNSHDRTSGYIVSAGLFRLACSNGLMVSSQNFDEIRVRHSGSKDIVNEVIEGTFKVLDEMPQIMQRVQDFKNVNLSREEQKLFAETALEIRGTSLSIPIDNMLVSRRTEDNANDDKSRDLWRTMNVVQEKLVTGGVRGLSSNGHRRSRLRAISSVGEDSKLNRALWQLTEKMADLKNGNATVIAA